LGCGLYNADTNIIGGVVENGSGTYQDLQITKFDGSNFGLGASREIMITEYVYSI
jgi:hypothetical protein